MKILKDGEGRVPDAVRTVITTGVYDGIHRGHQSVLARVRQEAKTRGAAVGVVTFDTHPAFVLRPESAPRLLMDAEQRLELFADQGVDYLYLVEFTPERAETTADEFITDVYVNAMHAGMVVVGSDFHFGKGRSGNVDLLAKRGSELGFKVIGLDLLADDGALEPISSTAIRRALAGGNVTAAAQMLGRLYAVRGTVIQGDQRGRQLGFPTANVPVDNRFAWPVDGVYAGWCTVVGDAAGGDDGKRYGCAINIGRRPTFHLHAEQSLLEAHLLDFSGDLYGKRVHVEFVQFLRSEQRFDGIEALSAQLTRDVGASRSALGI